MPTEFKITKDFEGISPKNYVKKIVDEPYHNLYKYFKNKRITLNGKKIKDDVKLKEGDVIKVWMDSIKIRDERNGNEDNKVSKNLGMNTIFENDDFLVLNKLPEVVVQGAQDNEKSLSYHLQFLKERAKSETEWFHVHRLDKDTSGVLICSKNMVAKRNLNAAFRSKDVVKKYVCLCVGKFKQKKGKVEVNLDRNEQGVLEKVRVSKDSGKWSLSYYNVICEYEFKGEVFSLVEVEIKSGVTHQIRVHMKYLGNPIVCDWMYGNSYINKKFEGILDRQFLHAKNLEMNFKGKRFKFEAELTNDLKKVMKRMRKK